jgi:hypothetical protein
MHMPIAMPAAVSLEMVRAALRQLVCRHAVLRTTYTFEDGTFSQVILPPDNFEIPLVEDDESANAAFEPLAAPPVRARLVSAANGNSELLLILHHVVMDHQCIPIFVRDMLVLLAGETLPPVPLQYADYAVWQSQSRSVDRRSEHLEWWRSHLASAPACMEVPLDARAQLCS